MLRKFVEALLMLPSGFWVLLKEKKMVNLVFTCLLHKGRLLGV